MRNPARLLDARNAFRKFVAEECGASLVEFSLVITLFLFLVLGLVDFGRIGHAWVGANKATQVAARLAAVRPPACDGVPLLNTRGAAVSAPAFGALCRAGEGICADPGPISCVGDASNATAQEIYAAIRPLVPIGTTIDQMRYSYTFDPNLGFLGGPYVPMVTVEFEDVNFIFISQLGAFVAALTGQDFDPWGCARVARHVRVLAGRRPRAGDQRVTA